MRTGEGINYESDNSSFCTFKEKLYFFPKDNHSEVFCFDLETAKSSLYLSE